MVPERRPPEPMPDDESLPSTAPHAAFVPDVGPGTMLGQFRIAGTLGRGGMGVVYEAEDTLLRRHVAIKLLPATSGPEDSTPRKLRREAQAVARLNHPNVVAVHHIGDWAGGHFLVLELMRGGSLQGRIRGGAAMPWREATKAIAHACRGLAAAHSAGLIHRDIKPANLMSDRAGLVKLADFGLVVGSDLTASSIAGELTASSSAAVVAGTPHFMCPEQCRGEPADERSDIYSLGATYFALLTGRPPFVGDPMPVMFAHCSNPTPNPATLTPGLPEECVAIVNRAMAKEPSDRYQTAGEMLAALQAVISPRSPEETQVTQPVVLPLKAHTRRGPILIALMVAIGLLLLAVVGIVAQFWPERLPTPTSAQSSDATLPRIEPALQPKPDAPRAKTPFGGTIPPDGLALELGGRVEALAFSPDGRRFAAGKSEQLLRGSSGVEVWDFASGKKETHLWGNEYIHCLVFTRRLEGLLRGSPGGCWIWHFNKNEEHTFFELGKVRAIAMPADDSFVAVGVFDGPERGRIHQWAYPGGQTRATLGEHGGPLVHQIVISPHDGTLVASYDNGDIKRWDPATGQLLRSPVAPSRQATILAYAPTRPVLTMACGPVIAFWDVKRWEWDGPRLQMEQDISALVYTPDGTHLVAAGGTEALLWEVSSGRRVHTFKGHTGPILAAAISPDGAVLATGGADGRARLWNLKNQLRP